MLSYGICPERFPALEKTRTRESSIVVVGDPSTPRNSCLRHQSNAAAAIRYYISATQHQRISNPISHTHAHREASDVDVGNEDLRLDEGRGMFEVARGLGVWGWREREIGGGELDRMKQW